MPWRPYLHFLVLMARAVLRRIALLHFDRFYLLELLFCRALLFKQRRMANLKYYSPPWISVPLFRFYS